MKINDEQTKLFIGHPKQERKLNWQIDQYTIEETDIFAGQFIYTQSQVTGRIVKRYIPI